MAYEDRTSYPVWSFHLFRSAQLLSSIVVASVMAYFLHELKRDHYRLPWTFLLLLTVSITTILSLTGTIIFYFCCGLNPIVNRGLNTVLLIAWVLGFTLLARWSSGTLAHVCNRANWDNETGIAICRTYKALFSFTLFGVVSTLFALALDLYVCWPATKRGKFTALRNLDYKGGQDDDGRTTAPLDGLTYSNHWEGANPNSIAARNNRHTQRGGEGYGIPEEQFAYDDGSAYHGAAEQIGRWDLGARM